VEGQLDCWVEDDLLVGIRTRGSLEIDVGG
jgi:hypothetical protein